MKKQYILFKENHMSENKEIYIKEVKYKIKEIKDNYIYFGKDKVSLDLHGKLYTLGNIINN